MKIHYFIIVVFILCLCCEESKESKIEYEKYNLEYDKAFNFLDKNEKDSAFYYFNISKDHFLKIGDSFAMAKCFVNMAIIQENAGDNFGSQETSLLALKQLKPDIADNHYYLALIYNNMGIVHTKLKEYNKSLPLFRKALQYSDDEINKIICENNLANIFREKSEYSSALLMYDEIMKKNIDNKEYSRTLTNLAFTQWLQNPNYNPLPEFQNALKIRMKEKDQWGLNSSYAHIADYYTPNNQDSALVYAKKMFQVAKEIKSPDDQIEALQKLIVLENSQNSKEYFQIYQKLNDSLQTARNKAKNQFALIRYETEKNKADFLKAQAESTQRRNVIILQFAILSFFILVIIWFVAYLKKRKKMHLQEKMLEVKNTELKYSKKVHDVVANGLYHTMVEIENQPELDKEKILNRIEKMYEESRDIAQDKTMEKDFHSRFYRMMNSYSSIDQRILPVGYKDDIWENTSDNIQSELYYIVREILVNMKKHSKAKLASLKFEKKQDSLTIRYTDNGIGINNLENKRRTGLRNTENRIDAIDGDITFEKNPNGGLIVVITVPTNLKYV